MRRVKRTVKTLIRLGRCPGWSESSLGAHSLCWFCHVVAQIVIAEYHYRHKYIQIHNPKISKGTYNHVFPLSPATYDNLGMNQTYKNISILKGFWWHTLALILCLSLMTHTCFHIMYLTKFLLEFIFTSSQLVITFITFCTKQHGLALAAVRDIISLRYPRCHFLPC